jgi:hypothetical protein
MEYIFYSRSKKHYEKGFSCGTGSHGLLAELQAMSSILFATTHDDHAPSTPPRSTGLQPRCPPPPHSAKWRPSSTDSTAASCYALRPRPFVLSFATRSSCIVCAPPLAVLFPACLLALHHPLPPLVVLSAARHPMHAPTYSPHAAHHPILLPRV